MGKTSYYSVRGRLLGEATSGAETTYMGDALGSTIGTVTSAGLRNRYVYKPYGGQLSKSGPDADPRFLWNARSGYRTTSRSYSEDYTRRRHVSTITAHWTTVDPKWPLQLAYVYVMGRPASRSDFSGTQAWPPPPRE